MLAFIGNIESKIDVKGRLFVPAQYRKQLHIEAGKGSVVMRKDPDNACLVIYPEDVWQDKLERFKSNLDEWNAEDQMLLMQFVSDAETLDIDSQGRILIQKKYLQQIGVEGEGLFVGGVDRFCLWSKGEFDKVKLSSADFAKKLRERMARKSDEQIKND